MWPFMFEPTFNIIADHLAQYPVPLSPLLIFTPPTNLKLLNLTYFLMYYNLEYIDLLNIP